MALSDFLGELDSLLADAQQKLAAVANDAALEAARVELLGAKSGRLKAVQKGLAGVAGADKPAAGQRFNAVKAALEAAFEEARERLAGDSPNASADVSGDPSFDVTVPGTRVKLGHLHPLTQTTELLKEILGRLGFSPVTGPEIEDEWHNFEALNIPAAHPARDPLENFYLATAAVGSQASPAAVAPGSTASASPADALLLRTQTSTIQIRVMEQTPPPVRVMAVGRVYRPDTADPTHYPMFHQVEGLWVDHHVTMAVLKSVLRLFASAYFGGDVHIRFRPSFFPFTEPSVEVDVEWHGRWIEMGGAGMVDPQVFRSVGYDPEKISGFAFGLGVERICMRRHNITDIREFYKNDVRFLHQFA